MRTEKVLSSQVCVSAGTLLFLLTVSGVNCQVTVKRGLVLPSSTRMQVRTVAAAAELRPTSSSAARRLQERRFPWASQSQTVMDSELVLLRDGLLPSEITTGRK